MFVMFWASGLHGGAWFAFSKVCFGIFLLWDPLEGAFHPFKTFVPSHKALTPWTLWHGAGSGVASAISAEALP